MPTALWYINDKLIVASPRIKIESDEQSGIYSLIIDPVEIKDEGEIKCMLRNKAGRVAVIAELLVDGKFFLHKCRFVILIFITCLY